MEFWIQVHGIPHDLMNKEIGILIGGMLGVLAEAKDPKVDGIFRRSYLRIRDMRRNMQEILFQGDDDMQLDLGATYNFKRLIREIRERNNEWAYTK
ncbi:hypothetical protein Ahy_A02g010051 [Arachis hypogaea]|uniref:DUF4283 domain-containing protein n=1 Tax=Arachis hypogaea TaxID=3818 RepID=A0A445EJ75_ARAHY|nr:hypothetical protein Ahy_A02g010051 [Arachis hypogaea]